MARDQPHTTSRPRRMRRNAFGQLVSQCGGDCTVDCGDCKGGRLSVTPQPGSEPVQVSREVPVTIISKADGTREVVETDTAEPCYACKCCVLWVRSVDILKESILEHERNEHALLGSPREDWARCLVCQLLAGAADAQAENWAAREIKPGEPEEY